MVAIARASRPADIPPNTNTANLGTQQIVNASARASSSVRVPPTANIATTVTVVLIVANITPTVIPAVVLSQAPVQTNQPSLALAPNQRRKKLKLLFFFFYFLAVALSQMRDM